MYKRQGIIAYAFRHFKYALLPPLVNGGLAQSCLSNAVRFLSCWVALLPFSDLSLIHIWYGVDWQDSHKYITYTDLAREQAGEKACKIRDNKLEKYLSLIHI